MRLRAVGLVVVSSLAIAGAIGAANPSEKPAVPVIRISTELIQLDAVVTDKNGRQVTDLGPADFEIRQDGKLRPVSRLAYVHTTATSPQGTTAEPGETSAPAPSTIVFVFDDLGLGPASFVRAKKALEAAVPKLAATDRVAVVSTARGFAKLEPSTDRQANMAAVEALRRTPWTRDELVSLGTPAATFFSLRHGNTRYDGGSFADWNSRLAIQSLGVVKMAIKELQSLPGRKALVLMSEGFAALPSFGASVIHDISWPLDELYGDTNDLPGALRRLADFSTRAAVVIHAIDPRGLVTSGIGAEDSIPGGHLADVGLSRRIYDLHRNATLEYLALETGGLAVLTNNDTSDAVDSVLADLGGYYLIGYEPDSQTFESGLFHDVDVKVRKPGLKIRSRKGFYAVTDEQVAEALQ